MKLLTTVLFVGLFLFAIVLLLVVIVAWPPRMGLDFTGGVRLVYEVDLEALEDEEDGDYSLAAFDMSNLVQALTSRINPSGTKEVIIRRCDEWQVEIIVPKADTREMHRIKKLIGTAGLLEFHIVAKRDHVRHQPVVALAEEQSKDGERRLSKYVRDADAVVGYWGRVDRVDANQKAIAPGVGPLRLDVADEVIRDAGTGELIQLPASFDAFEEFALDRYLMEHGIEEIDVLLFVDKDLALTGEHLGTVSREYDELMRPCIRFNATEEGAAIMAALTGSNLPDRQRHVYQRMAIVLDGKVLTAPRIMSTISDRGQITGDFTEDEIDFMANVLQAGALPVVLRGAPVSETAIAVEETSRQTARFFAFISLGTLLLIWLLMVVRYGVMGLGGSLASLLQLLMILAVIEVVRGSVTMPSIYASAAVVLLALAGHVLICESVRRRLRDEQCAPRSIWQSFLRSAVPFAILLAALWFAGIVAYVVGTSSLRSAAIPVVIGSMAALATCCLCLLLPVGLVAARFQTTPESTPAGISQ